MHFPVFKIDTDAASMDKKIFHHPTPSSEHPLLTAGCFLALAGGHSQQKDAQGLSERYGRGIDIVLSLASFPREDRRTLPLQLVFLTGQTWRDRA